MKLLFLILPLISFLGCNNSSEEKTVTETEKNQLDLYPIPDSTFFEIPCKLNSLDLVNYRASFTYKVEDMELAESQFKTILSNYKFNLNSRNENVSNNEYYKDFKFAVETEDFLLIEKKLDSLFRTTNKDVNINPSNYDNFVSDFEEQINSYKVYIKRYNAINNVPDRKEVDQLIMDARRAINSTKSSLISCCENKSDITVRFQMKLKKSDDLYVAPQPPQMFRHW